MNVSEFQDQQNLDEAMDEETEEKNPLLRNLNEIDELLEMAKVNRSNLTNDIQVLRFDDVVSSENLFLVEVSSSMLQSIENGSR